MKKILALTLVCVSLAATLAACGGNAGGSAKTGKCDMCLDENVAVRSLTFPDGVTQDFCDDCYGAAKALLGM